MTQGHQGHISRSIRRCLCMLCGLAAAGVASASAQSTPASSENTCLACHAMLSDARLAAPTTLFSGQDVHRERGFE